MMEKYGKVGTAFWKIDEIGTLSISSGSWNREGNTRFLSSERDSIKHIDGKYSFIVKKTLNELFSNFNTVKTIDLSGWNTSSVTDMSEMFEGCTSLKSLNLSNWNTSSVIDMWGMFVDCPNLEKVILDSNDSKIVEQLPGSKDNWYPISWYPISQAKLATSSGNSIGLGKIMWIRKDRIIQSIKLATHEISLKSNETFQLIPQIQPVEAKMAYIYWSSKDPDIARVSQEGLITGYHLGTTWITGIAVNGISTKVKIIVKESKKSSPEKERIFKELSSEVNLERERTVIRLYNPISNQYFYTTDFKEQEQFISNGWLVAGMGWNVPAISNTPVYRLRYDKIEDYYFTPNLDQITQLVLKGWRLEKIGWYSDESQEIPVYRLYQSNKGITSYYFTINEIERDLMISLGWMIEDTIWYGKR